MSIANLQNATWLDVNCKSINTQPAGAWATGAITFLGTPIAGGVSANYTITNNIVTLLLLIPSTIATAATAITFTNPLPAAIRPPSGGYGVGYCYDVVTAGNSKVLTWLIAPTGVVLLNLSANASVENYRLSLVMQYSMV